MQKTVSTDKCYKVSFFRPGTKGDYGISVEVNGDSKAKVLKEAEALLVDAEKFIENKKEVKNNELQNSSRTDS
jgi:hypothetical protein